MTTYHPTPVAPSGHNGCAFVDYADGHGDFQTGLPEWKQTPEGERLRAIREKFIDAWYRQRPVPRGGALNALAAKVGLRPSQFCDLERGRATLPAEEWTALLGAARAAVGEIRS